MEQSLFVRAIRKKDRQRFTIEWSDGKLCEYFSGQVQRCCPCAQCSSKTALSNESALAEDREEVEVLRIKGIGRYALQIVFSKGCSKGIYTLEQMRRLGMPSGSSHFLACGMLFFATTHFCGAMGFF